MATGSQTATGQHRTPLSRADARRMGLRESDLRGPSFQRVFYDVYVASNLPVGPRLRAACALKTAQSGARVSHHTAAELWDVWVPRQPETHLTVPLGSTRSRRQGIRAHGEASGGEATTRHGLPVSTPVQTFLEIAGELTLVDLVAFCDSLVGRSLATPSALRSAAMSFRGKGSRLARRAALLCRTGVGSVMETRLRLLLLLAGLPEPVVNHIVRGASGEWLMRFDLSYPWAKLIIEYDGRQHAESGAQWQRDLDRRESLDRDGWRIVVVRSTGIWDQPDVTLQRVVDAMRDMGMVGIPRRLNPQWRRHFPGRPA